jgi:hypothetical protein
MEVDVKLAGSGIKVERKSKPIGFRNWPTRTTTLLMLAWAFASPAATASAGRGADGEYEQRNSSHFELYQDVDIDKTSGMYGSRQFERSTLEVLEAAYRALDDALGMRPTQTIIVTIHDPVIFDARFAGNFRFPAAGFYGGTIHIRGDTVVTDRLVQVLHHELVHAAFDSALPSVRLPAWFNEGVAEWFEAQSIGLRGLTPWQNRALAELASRNQLFSFADLSRTSLGYMEPNAAHAAYLQSYGFIDFVARKKGPRRLRDLCRRLIRTGDLESAFRHIDRDGFEGLAAEYLDQLGGPSR